MAQPLNSSRRPPLKLAGVVFLVLAIALVTLVYLQFRGDLTPKTTLTMVSDRAGLVMDPGSKVTYNGVDRKSTRLNSSHIQKSRMPSSA